jgi:uncharacterized repeat protein (TIGR02543 family)
MSHHERFPEDVRDIASRLSEARVVPTEFELDELKQRIFRRAARAARVPKAASFARAMRMKLVAVPLTVALTLSAGVGVVFACENLGSGGGGSWKWPSPPSSASWCQYKGPWSYSDSWKTKHSTLTVLWFWDCKHLTVTISCGSWFGFKWGGGAWGDELTSFTSTAPSVTSGLTIDTDGTAFTFTTNGSSVTATATNSPSYTVAFNANGGSGLMAAQTTNAPTALTSDAFSRTGYTFAGWNTAANGTGTAYANGATYNFNTGTTLYAQWKANPSYTVTFNANGGSSGGSMASETHNTPTALTSDSLARAGYTFTGWNTAANGSGTSYANGATYAFTASATLYAQWRHN